MSEKTSQVKGFAVEIEPLKITGPSFIGKKFPSQQGPGTLRLWPTNRGVMSLTQISRELGVTRSMMEYRIDKSGIEIPKSAQDADRKKQAVKKRRALESVPIGSWERQMLASSRH